jgi:hypothetical protein
MIIENRRIYGVDFSLIDCLIKAISYKNYLLFCGILESS